MPPPVLIDTAWIEAHRAKGSEAVRRKVRPAIGVGRGSYTDPVAGHHLTAQKPTTAKYHRSRSRR